MKRLLMAALALLPLCAAAGPGDPLFSEGDWSVYDGSNNLSVLTVDTKDSSGFGFVCSKTTSICSWNLMKGPGQCKPGNRTPILILGEGVIAMASEMACDKVDPDVSSFEISGTDEITGLVTSAEKVSISIPTSESFEIVEFPTRGFARAVSRANREAPSKK